MKPGSPNRRGLTLAELAVFSAVFLLLLGGIYSVVEGGARYFRLAQAQETVNQQAIVAVRKMVTEMVNTSQSAISFSNTPQDYVVFLSAREPLPSTSTKYSYDPSTLEVQWQKWVSYYHDNQRIARAEVALGTPTTQPASVTLPNFTTDILPLSAQTVAHHVTQLEFTRAADTVYQIRLTTEERTGSNKVTNLEMITSVGVRN